MQQKASKMSKMRSVLRAVVWARKGSVTSNIFQKLVKKVIHSTKESSRALLYGDHEFSFHSTPLVHVRMTRPPSALRFIHIPCINPRPHFDDAMFFKAGEGEITEDTDDEGIDKRAEAFIAKFYQDMKLQS